MADILVCPLSWGLGHATRVIPLAREFLARGHRLTFGASGAALSLLRGEFAGCNFFEFPDYPHPYSRTSFFVARFTAFIPRMLAAIRAERLFFRDWLDRNPCDLVVSDNRFGVHDRRVPCFFISHQLRFHVPPAIFPAGWVTEIFNGEAHRPFERVIVPDNRPMDIRLSGRLSSSLHPVTRARAYYAGILCSTRRLDLPRDIDCLVTVSGPEPQRTSFERIVLDRVGELPGRRVVVLGRPAEDFTCLPAPGLEVRAHSSRREMAELLSRARFVVSRPGYTTMMEMAEVGVRRALFIPTPGQTEQEYLARYYRRRGWFHFRSQDRLDLVADVRAAGSSSFAGFPEVPGTAENVDRLYRDVFAPYL